MLICTGVQPDFLFIFVLGFILAWSTADFFPEYSYEICKVGETAFFCNFFAAHGTVYEQEASL